jgi:hypothetical protein
MRVSLHAHWLLLEWLASSKAGIIACVGEFAHDQWLRLIDLVGFLFLKARRASLSAGLDR